MFRVLSHIQSGLHNDHHSSSDSLLEVDGRSEVWLHRCRFEPARPTAEDVTTREAQHVAQALRMISKVPGGVHSIPFPIFATLFTDVLPSI